MGAGRSHWVHLGMPKELETRTRVLSIPLRRKLDPEQAQQRDPSCRGAAWPHTSCPPPGVPSPVCFLRQSSGEASSRPVTALWKCRCEVPCWDWEPLGYWLSTSFGSAGNPTSDWGMSGAPSSSCSPKPKVFVCIPPTAQVQRSPPHLLSSPSTSFL
ncbi:uncharacterized protein LOC124417047 isoform X2 [Gallus gallus]|uniref:uncharacterized protein LOC124417047 isoform X2 n=1 Tax=Gallus gallus TaxID=9031 RepID=UPI001F029C29|nr:uncharacterized protein LOC124417047 isoform X2 [Gallus gallus]